MSDDGANSQAVPEAPPSPAEPAAPMPAEAPAVETAAAEVAPPTQEPPAPVAAEPAQAPPPEPVPAPPAEPAPVPVPAIARAPRRPPELLIHLGWRLLHLVATVLVAAIIIFLVLELVPLPEEAARTGIVSWLGGLPLGNFGASTTQGTAIGPVLAERLAVSLPLILLAIVLATVIGPPLGVVAGLRPRGLRDRTLSTLFLVGTSTAAIWLAMLLALIFAVGLRLLPPGGFVPWLQDPLGAIASLLLPALALALPLAAALALATRDGLAAAQRAPMVATARAMGMSEPDIFRRALRNAVPPLAAALGLQLALLVPASVIVENVFYLPGLGRLILSGLAERDIPTLRAGLVTLVALIALARLGASVIRFAVDPDAREGLA